MELNLDFDKIGIFKSIGEKKILNLIKANVFQLRSFKNGEYIFNQADKARFLYILVEGGVEIAKNDLNGRRSLVNTFKKSGTVFGEVYLYLDRHSYDYSCMSIKDSRVILIPREFILGDGVDYSEVRKKLNINMLTILSEKAFFLNKKLLIQSSYTLRQKIVNYILQQEIENGELDLKFTREELADFIGTSRPSLSRELAKMKKDKLIDVNRSRIKILDSERMKDLL